MTPRRILFILEDSDLPKILEKHFSSMPRWKVDYERLSSLPEHASNHRYDLVILEYMKSLGDTFEQIKKHQALAHHSPLIAVPASLIRKNLPRLTEVVAGLMEEPGPAPSAPATQAVRGREVTAAGAGTSHPVKKAPGHDLLLEDFIERKLKDFVKKIKLTPSRNLYRLLLNEIEKPLFTLILKETRGNQIQAAQMLGMNRNTLRKKIRELRITVKRS